MASSDPLIGTTLSNRYRILRRIGEGGMGIVYEAEHVMIEKRVALKVLRSDFGGRSEVVRRFEQEAKSASRIGHKHIIDISDFGQTEHGHHFFVMELLDGCDLAKVLSDESPLPTLRSADIMIQCCLALGAAHEKGIVHRDMKPENIFLVEREGRKDFVKIVDFGIAKMTALDGRSTTGPKLTQTGMLFGTPEYMSPEQAGGRSVDHRSDIYALGIILYEMVAGRVPFVGENFMGVLSKHMFEAPPPLKQIHPHIDIPTDLERIIFRALHKDPDKRFQSMEKMAQALENSLVALRAHKRKQSLPFMPTLEHAETMDPPAPKRVEMRKIGYVGGAAFLILVTVGLYWLTSAKDEPERRMVRRLAKPAVTAPARSNTAVAPAERKPQGAPADAGTVTSVEKPETTNKPTASKPRRTTTSTRKPAAGVVPGKEPKETPKKDSDGSPSLEDLKPVPLGP